MNLAIVQPMADARAASRPYRDEVAVLAAALRQEGHGVSLVRVGPAEEADLAAAMAESRPDLVLMYVEGLAADAAVRAAGVVASVRGTPLIAFGPHARMCPNPCLSLPGAEAVAVGPADFTVPAYLERRGRTVDSLRAPGLWVQCETGTMRNPLPAPPASLVAQPMPARDLYLSDQVLDSAGFAPITVARGGETGPAATATVHGAPGSAGWPARHRPVDAVLDEMARVADEQLDLVGWRIGNARWMASPQWLAEFADRYQKQVRLPIRTTLHAPDVKDQGAALLARIGCEEAVVPIGSASHLIRNDVLGMDVPEGAIVMAFTALRCAGIRTVARVEVGAPYETSITLDETAALLGRLEVDRVEAVLHYPEPGSGVEKIAKENGWLVPDPTAAHLAGRPAVVPPSLSADAIVTACELMPYIVLRPRIVPLLRWARRVKIGRRGTAYDLLVKPFLAPPMRRKKR
ncbi:MAG TPA: hypothetical protein VM431_15930 [Phycisphaerae bacterium]|nr:hypothetical protein [Phycisphaerae bacterium]